MGFFERMDRHSSLLSAMGQTLRLDLADAVSRGIVAPNELRGQMVRCMSCSKGEACATWLAAHEGGAEAAPDYCRNGELFDRLAALRT